VAPREEERRAGDAREIWKLLVEHGFEILKDHIHSHMVESGLSSAQACLLKDLGRPMSQREAARQLGCDPSNITALADALEARGLVERRLDSSDRRIRTLARTPAGEEAARILEDGIMRPPAEIARLSPEDQVELLRLLRKVFSEPPD
jgi:DNA-binding MarR family transcriptional regulator